ncbi:MAG TPA: hypothetical protein VFG83_07105 [Kofleriaceae bacterium]|nr:hypothetical protein [Kofleriaceae bacterium]
MRGLAVTAAACLGVATGAGTAIAQPQPAAPPPDTAPVEQPVQQDATQPQANPDTDYDTYGTPVEAEPVYPPADQTAPTTVDRNATTTDQSSDYDYDTTNVEVNPTVEYEYNEEEPNLLTPFGMSLSVGGGIQNFVEENLRDVTDLAGMWEARLVVGTRLPVALEAEYVGSAQSLDALGVDSDAVLISNGLGGDLRFNFAWQNLSPYVFGGATWRHYYIADTDFNTSAIDDADDVFEIPLGVGLAYRVDRAIFDVRGTYRIAFDEELINPPGPELETADFDDSLDTWGVSLRVGFEF